MAEWDARREGFRRLARYIFGANRAGRDIAMTAPVAAAGRGGRIAMTVPVASGASGAGHLAMRFFLPAALTAQSAPAPIDARVRIVTEPARRMAVLRWAGAIRPEATRAAEARLVARLARTSWQAEGEPESWFYDPPSTPFFLRRNEAVVAVTPRG